MPLRPVPIGRRAPVPRTLLASLALALGAFALAQPTWLVSPLETVFARVPGAVGYAYVEAFSFPAGMTQIDTGIFVACDPAAHDGYELYLWLGPDAIPALDPFDDTVEVLTRLEREAVRSARWIVAGGGFRHEASADAATREALWGDLARGGVLSVRVLTDPARGNDQPTFQFQVDGFEEVEAALTCAAQAAAASDVAARAAVDPFADVAAPADPFADVAAPPDPFADVAAPADPFADAPAPADPFADVAAPADPFADAAPVDPFAEAAHPPADPFAPFTEQPLDPVTGLVSLGTTLDGYTDLPVLVALDEVFEFDDAQVVAHRWGDPDGRAFGLLCDSGAGPNQVLIDTMAPAFVLDTAFYLVLFAEGREVGAVELTTYRSDTGVYAYVTYDKDEEGIARALRAFPALDALLLRGGDDAVVDLWRLDVTGLRGALDRLDCLPSTW